MAYDRCLARLIGSDLPLRIHKGLMEVTEWNVAQVWILDDCHFHHVSARLA